MCGCYRTCALVYLLLGCISNTEGTNQDSLENADSECPGEDPWRVEVATADGMRVRWEGADREAELKVGVRNTSAVPDPAAKCRWKFEVVLDFGQREFTIGRDTDTGQKPLCLNTAYQIDATLSCGGKAGEAKSQAAWMPPDVPRNVTVSKVNSSSIEVHWSPPPGEVERFRVKVNDATFEVDDPRSTIGRLSAATAYSIQVAARSHDNWGKFSEPISTMTSEIEPPENLRIWNVSSSSVTVEWDTPKGFQSSLLGYSVSWRDIPLSLPKEEITTDTRYFILQLNPLTNYSVTVCTRTETEYGLCTMPLLALTTAGVPPPPDNVHSGKLTNTSVEVLWEAPVQYSQHISQYSVRWREEESGGAWLVSDASSSPHVVAGLSPFTSYEIEVACLTDDGAGDFSDPIVATTDVGVPNVPFNLTTLSVTNTSIHVSWEKPVPSVGPVNFYRIEWHCAEPDCKVFRALSKKANYEIGHLPPFKNFSIHVRANTQAGHGNWSQDLVAQTSIGMPSAPRNLKEVSATNTSIEISWEEPAPSAGPVLKYNVSWAPLVGGGGPFHDTTENRSFVVFGLAPFTNYSVRVSAETAAGPGDWSEDLVIRTEVGIPGPPSALKVDRLTDRSVAVSWGPPDRPSGAVENYEVRWSRPGKSEESGIVAEAHYEIGRLEAYAFYSVSVRAKTAAGYGEWTGDLVVRTLSGEPFAPFDLQKKTVTNLTIEIEWKEPTPFKGPITQYRIQLRKMLTNESKFENSSLARFKFSGLSPFTWYGIKVQAQTGAGFGAWSGEIELQTDIGIPGIPHNLTLANKTSRSAKLTWLPPSPSAGPVVGYAVEWMCVSTPICSEIGDNETVAESFHIQDLTPFTEYWFKVKARTKAGWGSFTEPFTVKTDIDTPSEPRNFRAVFVTEYEIGLEWDPPERANGPSLTYALSWRKRLGEEGLQIVSVTNYTIIFLLPFTEYKIMLAAGTAAGPGPVARLDVRTNVAVPISAQILGVSTNTRREASLEWLSPDPYPGPTEYAIEVWRVPGPCEVGVATLEKIVKGGAKSWSRDWAASTRNTVDSLTPYTKYAFRVVLKTSAGQNVSAMSDAATTLPDTPGAPTDVRADCKSASTEALLRWKPPKQPNGKIVEYRVKYGDEISARWSDSAVGVARGQQCQEQKLLLGGMRPERSYRVIVRARVEGVPDDGEPAFMGSPCVLPAGIPTVNNATSLLSKARGPYHLTLEWEQGIFSDFMGELTHYAVIVGSLDAVGNATSGTIPVIIPPWANYSAGFSEVYQATPDGWNPFKKNSGDPLKCREIEIKSLRNAILQCTIGLEDDCSENATACNARLHPTTSYAIKMRAFTRGGYAETEPIIARTDPVSMSGLIGGVVSGFVFFLLIGAVVLGALVLKRNGKLLPLLQSIRLRLESRTISPSQPPSIVHMQPIVQEVPEYQIPEPLIMKNFVDHVLRMMSDSHLKFSIEFETLKKNSPTYPSTAAHMDGNETKNRWKNILPYDHSRVKLLPLDDDTTTDYINANYIPGCYSLREYIATQGPLPHTVDDLWRMAWEQRVSVAVMLTQCSERGRTKCEQYWPDDARRPRRYGDLRVTVVDECDSGAYSIRTCLLQLGTQERIVSHMHFTRWPDFGCPESPEELIDFVRAVRDRVPRNRPGPILVHCSAGVGRTGTFIAVDRIAQQLSSEPEAPVDVYGVVMEMRQQRVNMVQTEDQYIYIHLCIKHLVEEMTNTQCASSDPIYSNLYTVMDTGV